MGKRLFVILSIGLANAFVFTVLATGFTQQAFAQSPPAVDKYAAAGSTTIVFGPTITGTTTATLLSEQINSSNTADLVLQVSLECTIFTAQTTSFADSDARVTVWIEIDGVVVPVTSDAAGNPTDPPPVGEVTFCDHTHVNFSGTAFDLE